MKWKFGPLNTLIISITLAILSLLIFVSYETMIGKAGRAALTVESLNGYASVIVDGKDYGKAPLYTENVNSKNLNVTLNGKNRSYTTVIRPAAGTSAVVSRDLGVSDYFSSGEDIWFEKTGGSDAIVSVTSPKVDGVNVLVESVSVGKTPVRFATKDLLSENENNEYDISFEREGYDVQNLHITVKKGYTLHIKVDPFLDPFPKDVTKLAAFDLDNVIFLNLSKVSGAAFIDRQAWAKALNYWLNTRGSVKVGDENVSKFDYFITDNGIVFNELGNQIKPNEIDTSKNIVIAYLGSSDKDGLSDKAKEVVKLATGKDAVGGNVSSGSKDLGKVKIGDTGIGHLNVRSGPGVSNNKVGQVAVGDVFDVLDKKNGWSQIEYEKGNKGWVIDKYLIEVKKDN